MQKKFKKILVIYFNFWPLIAAPKYRLINADQILYIAHPSINPLYYPPSKYQPRLRKAVSRPY